MKTGRLLDVLGGHEGPVHGLMFSPTSVSDVFYLYWNTKFVSNSCLLFSHNVYLFVIG